MVGPMQPMAAVGKFMVGGADGVAAQHEEGWRREFVAGGRGGKARHTL